MKEELYEFIKKESKEIIINSNVLKDVILSKSKKEVNSMVGYSEVCMMFGRIEGFKIGLIQALSELLEKGIDDETERRVLETYLHYIEKLSPEEVYALYHK